MHIMRRLTAFGHFIKCETAFYKISNELAILWNEFFFLFIIDCGYLGKCIMTILFFQNLQDSYSDNSFSSEYNVYTWHLSLFEDKLYLFTTVSQRTYMFVAQNQTDPTLNFQFWDIPCWSFQNTNTSISLVFGAFDFHFEDNEWLFRNT